MTTQSLPSWFKVCWLNNLHFCLPFQDNRYTEFRKLFNTVWFAPVSFQAFFFFFQVAYFDMIPKHSHFSPMENAHTKYNYVGLCTCISIFVHVYCTYCCWYCKFVGLSRDCKNSIWFGRFSGLKWSTGNRQVTHYEFEWNKLRRTCIVIKFKRRTMEFYCVVGQSQNLAFLHDILT